MKKNINTKKYIEKYLKIKDKNSKIIPFKLNMPQQRLYDAIKNLKQQHKPVRIIILKARQMGFSTLTEAILFKETATKHNVNAGIVAHVEEATNNLFTMSKLYYSELPDEIKPKLLNSNAKELIFNNKEGTGLNSKIRCMTAGSTGVGRSGTYNILHLSEYAFWQGDKKTILNGLVQTVPNNESSMIVIESTANGYEHFKEIWDGAVKKENDYIPVFIGWNELPEYSMEYTGFELTSEEKKLKELYNLTLEQITWRRWCIRNNCQNDKNLFKQEYPINPHEAFLSTGTHYFNNENVLERLETIKPPIRTGYFRYTYENEQIKDYRWQDDPEGFIKIYKDKQDRIPYVLGGDTSGEGSDYFTGHVLDNTTGEQVAVLRQEFNEVEYTRQMVCLARYYNEALLGIEANFSTYPIQEAERLRYTKQYVREEEDTFTGRVAKKFGFKTTSVSRPRILAGLQTIVLENVNLINDKDTLEEMLVFVRNEKGRPEAKEGEHDDLVMGLAIAYDIREQQSFEVEQRRYTQSYGGLNVNSDFGARIEII